MLHSAKVASAWRALQPPRSPPPSKPEQRPPARRTWEAAQAPKAPRMTSTTRWDVSTLPPTTAASGDGSKIEPLGITTRTGARQPCGGRGRLSGAKGEMRPTCQHLQDRSNIRLLGWLRPRFTQGDLGLGVNLLTSHTGHPCAPG